MLKRLFSKRNSPFSLSFPNFFPVLASGAVSNKIWTPNLKTVSARKLSSTPTRLAKIFANTENNYFYNHLPQLPPAINKLDAGDPIETLDDFELLLGRPWRGATASDIVVAFKTIQPFCCAHEIPLSDPRFDSLVDGLMDNCGKLSDIELLALLNCICEYPECHTITAHNFHDIWSCLDDICCWKMGAWSLDTTFQFVDVWYRLNLGRICDFVFEAIDKCTRRAGKLNREHLVYLFFCINICRRRGVDFEFEHAVCERIEEFTLEELAVIALGYFKSKSKVKLKRILDVMLERVGENCETINDYVLTAILKGVRFSQCNWLSPNLTSVLDKLLWQIPRLSPLSCLHIALIGTSIQYCHPKTLQAATQHIFENLKVTRIKDIERILLANTMFNFNPETSPDFYQSILGELQSEERRQEMAVYPRCLPPALNYLSQRAIYDYNLLDRVLDEEFIHELYGKNPKLLPRDLFSLDACIEIECPQYRGNRLKPDKKYKAAKWLTEFAPDLGQYKKLIASDKFFLEVKRVVGGAVGQENVRVDHILPHFWRADLVVCKEKNGGRFVEPHGFENYILGDVKRPLFTDKLDWFVFIMLTPNITIRDTFLPMGSVVQKQRQLKILGYNPVLVFWNQFSQFSDDDKLEFVKKSLELS